jgi:hypothetical protein
MPDVRAAPRVRKIEGRVEDILRGMFCEHRRMRLAKCEYCKTPCRVECPDCGLSWMFGEGIFG